MLIAAGPRKGINAFMQTLRETRALLDALTDPIVMARMHNRPENGLLVIDVPLKHPTHTVSIECHGDVISISVVESTK